MTTRHNTNLIHTSTSECEAPRPTNERQTKRNFMSGNTGLALAFFCFFLAALLLRFEIWHSHLHSVLLIPFF
ncbi:hypothetical protein N431DRAFT_16041 [Stipitochalara longipes BDJ]|nr:hypothetical protein N431DRAFT_16041 [Stipitochalara longipes BDJ]